jgi:hypothetical protein
VGVSGLPLSVGGADTALDMAHYLVERYLPPSRRASLDRDRDRIVLASNGDARLLETLYVGDDEVCLHLFESESPALVGRAGRRAGVQFDRIVAVQVCGAPTAHHTQGEK